IYLDEFYGTKDASDYEKATEIVWQAMLQLRKELNEYVEKVNPKLAAKHKKEMEKKAKELNG
ncbi:MAG: hypothetical protein ACI4MT_06175, partial [Christensenellales bacterium]